MEDIRWKQRFDNFEKSIGFLRQATSIEHPTFVEKAGLIQLFEMSFELAWNVLKDYLEEQGFSEIKTPKDSLKKAFELEIIADGHMWLQALKDRNLTSHTYDETLADKVVQQIAHDYAPLLLSLYVSMKSKY
jgi:nucleotidyltransferase substrate binding protein (TIGR01987 family)